MAANITDLLARVTDSTTGRPVIAQLAAPGKAIGAASINLTDATNWTTTTAIHFSMYSTVTVAGVTVKDPTTQTDWKGTLAGTVVSGLTLTGGTDRSYTSGAIVEITPTARWAKDLYDNISAHANQDGSLKTSAVQTALNIGTTNPDWTPLATVPSVAASNGQREFSLSFAGVDYTDRLQQGTKLKIPRTSTAPTQAMSFTAVGQYASKTSPAGITFTDDFTVETWIYLTSYPTAQTTVLSRMTGAGGGWQMRLETTGQFGIQGLGAASAPNELATTYQLIPLNRWVHIAATLDMSGNLSTTFIDGVSVPNSYNQASAGTA